MTREHRSTSRCRGEPAYDRAAAHSHHEPATTRVFIVDDDERVRCALARLLRASGYHVECFDSPEAFLDRTDLASTPACLVLDLQMSGMTGLEVQRKLNQLVPIVFLTGHGDVVSSVDAMKAGASTF